MKACLQSHILLKIGNKILQFDPKNFISPLDMFKNKEKNNDLEKLKQQIKEQQQQIQEQERFEKEKQEALRVKPAPAPVGKSTLPSGFGNSAGITLP